MKELFDGVLSTKNILRVTLIIGVLAAYYVYLDSIITISVSAQNVFAVEFIVIFFLLILRLNLDEKYYIWYDLLLLISISFYISITLDFLNGTYDVMFEEARKLFVIRFMFSGLLTFLLFLFFVALFKNVKTAVTAGVFVLLIFGFIGYAVYQFRGSRLLFADISALRTAMDVVSGYDTISVEPALLLGICSFFFIIPQLFMFKPLSFSWKSLKRLGCYLVCIFGIYFIVNSSFNQYYYSWIEVSNSYVYSFFTNIKFLNIEPSKNYDSEEITKLLKNSRKGESILANSNFDPGPEIAQKFPNYVKEKSSTFPNIIVVMNESLSDLDVLGESKTRNKIFKNIDSLPNTVKGNVYVDVRGGGTADSEYDFLTGTTTLILPENARPYEFYTDSDDANLVTYLNHLNYDTVAIHPGQANAWNRNYVYNNQFDFKETIFADQFPGAGYFRDRNMIADRETYKKAVSEVMDQRNKPLFVLDVTIQNHGGYYMGYENLEELSFDEPENAKLPDEAKEFLSLMKSSDVQFKELIDQLNSIQQPTVVLLFGDHQPKFLAQFPSYYNPSSNLNIEKRMQLQKTPFVIWANYDLPDQTIKDISINYLSTLLMECAGIKRPNYNAYLEDLYQEIRVINRFGFITKDGGYYSFDDPNIPEKYRDLINQYEDVLYYTIIDTKNSDNKQFDQFPP